MACTLHLHFKPSLMAWRRRGCISQLWAPTHSTSNSHMLFAQFPVENGMMGGWAAVLLTSQVGIASLQLCFVYCLSDAGGQTQGEAQTPSLIDTLDSVSLNVYEWRIITVHTLVQSLSSAQWGSLATPRRPGPLRLSVPISTHPTATVISPPLKPGCQVSCIQLCPLGSGL